MLYTSPTPNCMSYYVYHTLKQMEVNDIWNTASGEYNLQPWNILCSQKMSLFIVSLSSDVVVLFCLIKIQ